MAKKKKKKKKKEIIGLINGIELVKKSAPKVDLSFRTGKYLTDKDRPRDKSYKKYNGDDYE